MDKQIHFIAGLPRSGSTLLANLLAQNPRFHATSTSGILEVLVSIRNGWEKLDEFRASPNENAKINVMRAILFAYHQEAQRPVVFDKSRGWLAYIEMAELLLQRRAKVLVPVRDLRDILASFEMLWRNNTASRQPAVEASHYIDFQSIEGRCETLVRPDQPVGIAYARVRDAVVRGLRDRMHFVHFEQLSSRPKETMQAVYAFLGEPYFDHDFDNVQQVTTENDAVHGYPGMHKIRSKVQAIPSRARDVLGPAYDRYPGPWVWNQM